jgi:hypothetical protein
MFARIALSVGIAIPLISWLSPCPGQDGEGSFKLGLAPSGGGLFSGGAGFAADPASAFHAWLSNPKFLNGGQWDRFANICRQWIAVDREGAIAAIAGVHGNHRQIALYHFGGGFAEVDPVAAWEWATAQPEAENPSRGLDARAGVLTAWSTVDMRAAAKAAAGLPAGPVRTEILPRLLSRFGARDAQGALELALGLPDSPERWQSLAGLAGSARDRSAMLAILTRDIPPGPVYKQGMRALFKNWSEADPAGAARGYMSLSRSTLDTDLANFIVSGWIAKGDRTAAWAWAQSLPRSNARAQACAAVFGSWADEDPDAAGRAALLLPEPDRTRAAWAVFSCWSEKDVKGLLGWLPELADAALRKGLVDTGLGKLMKTDIAEAAAWAGTAPPDLRSRAVERVAEQWARSDPEAALVWLQRLPPEEWRDGGVVMLAAVLAQEDPVGALAWARSITDPGRRDTFMAGVHRRWVARDPASARGWRAEGVDAGPALRKSLAEER